LQRHHLQHHRCTYYRILEAVAVHRHLLFSTVLTITLHWIIYHLRPLKMSLL
jgi:hypothetical protein